MVPWGGGRRGPPNPGPRGWALQAKGFFASRCRSNQAACRLGGGGERAVGESTLLSSLLKRSLKVRKASTCPKPCFLGSSWPTPGLCGQEGEITV